MFSGRVVWRGLVYSILMALAKVTCGLWLVRFSLPTFDFPPVRWFAKLLVRPTQNAAPSSAPETTTIPLDGVAAVQDSAGSAITTEPCVTQPSGSTSQDNEKSLTPRSQARPSRSMYPAAIVGCAMVARGEIGFLVSALAASTGVFDRPSTPTSSPSSTAPSDLFLVVTWAIMLCTIIGPLAVGILVRHVRSLEQRRREIGATGDVLGTWGVDIKLDVK